MMKLTFIYDGILASDADGHYYGRAYTALPEKYSVMADDITFVMRTKKVSDVQSYTALPDNVRIVSVPDQRAGGGFFAKRREIRKILAVEISRSDIVILREPCFFSSIANRALKRAGKPYLVESVGCPWDSYRNHGIAGMLLAPFEYLQTKRSIANAPFVSYVTESFLQKRYPTKGVSAAISDVELVPTDGDVLKKRLEKIENHFGVWKIGTAGAVNVSYKGQQYVIQALARLKALGRTDYEYHLAGGGDCSTLKCLAEKLGVANQVAFDGSLPHEQMFDWLDELDIYIQPSLQEGLPRAVVEAMSRGLPVFGARTGGIPELLGAEDVLPQRDSRGIAAALSAITKDKLAGMARRSFRRAEDFEYSALNARRNDFYAAFLAAYKEKQE